MKQIILILLSLLILAMMLPTATAYDCWRGLNGTVKQGQYGTMQEGGFVPDSVKVRCTEYQVWVSTLPTPIPTEVYEEKLVATTGLDPVTQAAISAATGAGAAYLVVRRKKAA